MDLRPVINFLGKSALFGSLAELDRAVIAGRMRRVDFQPNQMLFSRGDAGREIYVVLQGRIRLSVLTTDGRELAFAHAGPGDIFGEIAALDGDERSAGATALTHAQVASLSHKAILELIETNPKLALAAIGFLCSRLRATDLRLEAIALYPIEVRLARLLLSALKSESPHANGSNIELDLGITRTELALLIGASRPKVSHALTFLQNVGAITRSGTQLICNAAILQGVAELQLKNENLNN
jgi:CRP/FNR family transcriptional regulator, cyclic AMP receptor protein